jgi:hypothetical protein
MDVNGACDICCDEDPIQMVDRRTRIIEYLEGRLRSLVEGVWLMGGSGDRSSRVTRIFQVFPRKRHVPPKKVKTLYTSAITPSIHLINIITTRLQDSELNY